MNYIKLKVFNLYGGAALMEANHGTKNYLIIGFEESYELKNLEQYHEYYNRTINFDGNAHNIQTPIPIIKYKPSGNYEQNEQTYNIETMNLSSGKDYTQIPNWGIYEDQYFDVIFIDRGVKALIPGLNSQYTYPFDSVETANNIYNQIYKKLKDNGKLYIWNLPSQFRTQAYYSQMERIDKGASIHYLKTPFGNRFFDLIFDSNNGNGEEIIVEDPIEHLRTPTHGQSRDGGVSRGQFIEYKKKSPVPPAAKAIIDASV